MDCPVCGTAAENVADRQWDGKTIRCTKCGTYDISGTVYDTGALRKLSPDERLRVLNKAKYMAGAKRPMITSYVISN